MLTAGRNGNTMRARWMIAAIFTALVAMLAPLASGQPGQAAAGMSATDIARIDAFVSQQMQRHKLPGMALALVDGDRVILMKGYGQADPSGRPVTPQTPFLLASVSKPLTALAVMQLVEAGQIDLDTPLRRYLPEFRLADPAAADQITLRHLLLHTSGLPTTACDTRRNAQTLAEYVSELQPVQLAAPVGSRHIYCSGNYNLLGRMIEVVSGQPFGDYMQQHVFAPLDMQHSFTGEVEARQAGLAQGYQWILGLPVATRPRYNPSQLPSGSMISSAEDLSHFLIAQLNGGRYGQARLVSEQSISAMQAPGTKRGSNGEYGLGWVIAPLGGVPAVSHDGAGTNAHTLVLIQPESRRGMVVLFNSFGIVPYSSAYPEIEAGIARLLAGLEPAAESRLSLGGLYALIDLFLLAGLALAAWPLLRLPRWHRAWIERRRFANHPLWREMLRPAVEIGLGLLFLAFVRVVLVGGLGAQSWGEVLQTFPDFVAWIWAVVLLVLLTGILRGAWILKTRRASRPIEITAPSGTSA